MVQQGRELQLLVPLGCFTYTVQPAWPALPTLRPARVRLFRVLLGKRPSLRNLLRPSLAFVRLLRRYYATMRLPAAVRVGVIAHRFLPPSLRGSGSGGNRVSRFSCVKFLCMHGVYDSASPVAHSRLRTPQYCLPDRLTPSALILLGFCHFRSSSTSGIPSLHIPIPNASSASFASRRPHMVWARMDLLVLSCLTLSFRSEEHTSEL